MYRCSICYNVVPPNNPCQKRVLQTRVKHYPERAHAKREWRNVKGKWKKVWIPDPGGVGTEIVYEAKCCANCALKIDKGDE